MLGIFNRNRKPKNKPPTLRQFIFIEAPIERVSREIVTWGESVWWPTQCLWNYRRTTDGEPAVGTLYTLKINKPSAPDWAVEVTRLEPQKMVERTFRKGMFKGREVVLMEERANGTRVDYELYFTIQGPLNLVLWPLVLRQQYLRTIKSILSSLKKYMQDKYPYNPTAVELTS